MVSSLGTLGASGQEAFRWRAERPDERSGKLLKGEVVVILQSFVAQAQMRIAVLCTNGRGKPMKCQQWVW